MKRQSDEFEKNEQLNDDERKDSVDNSVQGNSKEDAQKSLFDDALFGVEATETNVHLTLKDIIPTVTALTDTVHISIIHTDIIHARKRCRHLQKFC